MTHVISYFNNRGCSKHYLWNYHHVFGIFSPVIHNEHRLQLNEQLEELNKLLQGPRQEVIEECSKQLNTDFKPSVALETEDKLFQVESIICIDMITLSTNKQ